MLDLASANYYGLLCQWGVVIGASLAAALWDVRGRRIPNALTGPLIVSGLVWAWCQGGWWGVGDAAVGGLVAGLPFIVLFATAGGGAGDAKLMIGAGAWLGLAGATLLCCVVAIAGGVVAILYACLDRRRWQSLRNLYTMLMGVVVVAVTRGKLSELSAWSCNRSKMVTMPYGPSILLGACVAAGVAFIWRIGM